MSDLKLWYDAPAEAWTAALPIGNGRLGAMVFGGIARERLQLNEDTLWAGGPYSQVNPEAKERLDEVRRLIFSGQYPQAERLADRHLMGRPLRQMPYQPAGDLWVEQAAGAGITNYRRELELDSAIQTTAFTAGEVAFTREVFASAVDDIIVIRLSANRPGRIDARLEFTSQQAGEADPADSGAIGWSGRNREAEGIVGGLRFAIRARVRASGGTLTPAGPSLQVSGADEVVVLLDAATSFRRFDDPDGDPDAAIAARLDAALGKSFEALRAAHVAEHQRLFRRLEIDLGDATTPGLTTDARIAANVERADPALAALYVQYGRYLMMASSRPGTQAANLQGIWNDLVDPPWGSKYTSNINLQMNYWLPDPANLSECVAPLIQLVEEVSETGEEIARVHYGARGWVMHHNTDIWRAAAPVDGAKWGLWPTGGAWLCAQLWDHAVFAGRPDPLVRRLYPVMAGAARFILDALVPLPGTDLLVTCPSVSPENVHPVGASLCAGPAMDSQIVRDLFNALLEAAAQVGIEDDLVAECRRTVTRLPPDRVGRAGQLQEWLEDWDMDVPEIHHRHVSHLYALYPSQQIDPDRTPDLAAAARRSLEIRGDDATGWGIGWRINLWARLRDGDHAHGVLQKLLSPERTYPNMFDAHPPFQIDGNFGGAAGVLEMLVQCTANAIRLLPALPDAWPDGHLRGVRCRGNITVDLSWSGGALSSATLYSAEDRVVQVHYPGGHATAELAADQGWSLVPG